MRSASRQNSNRQSSPRRNGVAAVELAICLPVLVTLMLATIEACTMYHVQQTLKITAYEGARVGTVPGATSTNVEFQCGNILDDHGVSGYAITMDPADPSTLGEGDYLTVTASAAFADNALIGGWFYQGMTLSRSVALRND
ncbi:TadE/TadG family type IV pilus assembly protein [Stieleria varia]|uniref:TadE-like protein n=1 Tax=Stieleria varia TaxID=2528005 RepID=A0A5C6AWY3_9BACT|nr:TadE family protein [Stieleria varia]TWU02624.1 TadE-like protein [Stieleria varia]